MSADPTATTSDQPFSILTFAAHRQMVVTLFISTLIVSWILFKNLLGSDPQCLEAVALAGAIGGFVSALRRFYTFDATTLASPATRYFSRSKVYMVVYSLIPPLIGMVAAAVIYTLLATTLFKAGVFPTFADHPEGGAAQIAARSHFQHFLFDWKPDTSIDYAKALIWGFIAGFSERVVPSMLDKLGADAAK